jgi:hypothetical protein
MKNLVFCSIIFLFIIGCSDEYKLSIEVSGNGTYQVSPQKSNYDDGDAVTIKAIADSGWSFNKWQGAEDETYNPLFLTMNGDKYLKLVFGIPYKPSMSGDWQSIQYPIQFHIHQAGFDSSLTGSMVGPSSTGGTITFSVTGYNRRTIIKMYGKATGYYDITFTGHWINESNVDGGIMEAGVYYDCDLTRDGAPPLAMTKLPFITKKTDE